MYSKNNMYSVYNDSDANDDGDDDAPILVFIFI